MARPSPCGDGVLGDTPPPHRARAQRKTPGSRQEAASRGLQTFAIRTPIAKRLRGVADDSRGVREGGHEQSLGRGRMFQASGNSPARPSRPIGHQDGHSRVERPLKTALQQVTPSCTYILTRFGPKFRSAALSGRVQQATFHAKMTPASCEPAPDANLPAMFDKESA